MTAAKFRPFFLLLKTMLHTAIVECKIEMIKLGFLDSPVVQNVLYQRWIHHMVDKQCGS